MQRLLKLLPVLIVTLITWSLPMASHAQLSCDPAPAPFDNPEVLANWQTIWELTDICLSVPGIFEEVVSGGVPRDGIPPIDFPTMDDQVTTDQWLSPQSPVISVEIDGTARAYPLAILIAHEIVNDVIGETPIAVTYCPLCNSAIVFDRRMDGGTLRMGVSGLLRNSDLIMWDDLTQTWWQQFTGEGIVGTYTGRYLDIVPSQVVGYAAFKEQYPDGEILSPEGRGYGSNPYTSYDSSSQPFLFRNTIDTRLYATSRVLGIHHNEVSQSYPFDVLREEKVINDTVGETDVVAFWQRGSVSAIDNGFIDLSKDVGMASLFERTLDGQVLTFTFDGDVIVDDQTGSTWNIFGTAAAGELAGSQLNQLNAFPHLWFAWAAFYPDTTIYGQDELVLDANTLERYELDPVYGNPDAPVTLIEYGSYACSACRYWHEEGFIEDLIQGFDGQVNLIFRDMPVVSPEYDQMGGEVAQCALDQGNDEYWLFHDGMYTLARPGQSSVNDMIEIGRQVGLDGDALRACYDAGTHTQTVLFDFSRGNDLGIRGTPTFFVGGQPLFNANPDILREALLAELVALED
jgi:protein-disulfide isomerase